MNELLSPTVVGRMLLACWKEDRRASCCRIVACAGPHPRSPIINRRPTRLDRRCCQRRPPLPRTRIVIATSATITTTNITTTTTIITITNASRPPLLLPRLLPSRARITLCYRHRRRRPRRRPLFTTFNHGLDANRSEPTDVEMHDRTLSFLSIGSPIDFLVYTRVSFFRFVSNWVR